MSRTLTAQALLLLPLLLFPSPRLEAQDLATLRPGDRVRLVSGMHRGVYDVAEAPDLVLVDRTGNRLTVDSADIDRLDVQRGHESRFNSAVRGSLIGGGTGVVAGAVLAYATEGNDGFFTPEEVAILGGIVGGAFGFAGGAVVGAVIPRARWVPLVPVTRFSVAPRGRGGVSVSLARAF
jgi:hypothetical protein